MATRKKRADDSATPQDPSPSAHPTPPDAAAPDAAGAAALTGQDTPDETKPDEAKPDEAKPDEAKPDEAKPGRDKPGKLKRAKRAIEALVHSATRKHDESYRKLFDTKRNPKAKKERGSILEQLETTDAQAILRQVEHSGRLQMPKRRRDPSL